MIPILIHISKKSWLHEKLLNFYVLILINSNIPPIKLIIKCPIEPTSLIVCLPCKSINFIINELSVYKWYILICRSLIFLQTSCNTMQLFFLNIILSSTIKKGVFKLTVQFNVVFPWDYRYNSVSIFTWYPHIVFK